MNVASLLLERETGIGFRGQNAKSCTIREREKGLQGWVTNEASRHCYSECCTLNNTPRSTIAATINRDGTRIASTHGDHTVKIINFETGAFEKELVGHRRTPWTVKFHPTQSHLLVSGSLDSEVRLWDTDLGICLQSKDFGRQISSVSFHPSGKALAIAAGHKLHIWEFIEEEGRFGKASCIFRTNRTIRTTHFSPVGGMIMVSERVEPNAVPAEVPRPAQRTANEHVPVMQQPPHVPWNEFPQDPWLRGPQAMAPTARGGTVGLFPMRDNRSLGNASELPTQRAGTAVNYPFAAVSQPETRSSDVILRQMAQPQHPLLAFPPLEILPTVQRANPSDDPLHQFPDPQRLPNASATQLNSVTHRIRGPNPRPLCIAPQQTLPVLSLMPMNAANLEITRTGQPSEMPRPPPMLWNQHPNAVMPPVPGNNNELPHVTKLVLYEFNVQQPHTTLNQEVLRIDRAVICSEMGAHISPCGRMLVVCVASPRTDRRVPNHSGFHYELRVISLEKQTFGAILRTRSISAGHCLTSVQFSPGSDMILLSYGRKHASLLRCLEMNGATVAQIHTLLELYSAKTLTLVRVMHSAEDEANTASFHPYAGEGIVYGTKNGKLRILRHKRTHTNGDEGDIKDHDNELLEVLEDELQ